MKELTFEKLPVPPGASESQRSLTFANRVASRLTSMGLTVTHVRGMSMLSDLDGMNVERMDLIVKTKRRIKQYCMLEPLVEDAAVTQILSMHFGQTWILR